MTTTTKIALDTNILIYLFDAENLNKRKISEQLLLKLPIISTQVVSEFINVSKRILLLSKDLLLQKCISVFNFCTITQVNKETLKLSQKILLKYDFQIFDSIIIASALQNNADILYTEDLTNGQIIEGTLKIVNPFI